MPYKRLHILTGILVASLLLLAAPSLAARDWSDLDEPDIYGSDTEGKYTNFVLARIEDWKNEKGQERQGFHFLWLIRATWYPRYNSYMLFPLAYRLNSKVDDRRETILFPLYFRKYEDEKNDFIITPVAYHSKEDGDSLTILGPTYYKENIRGEPGKTYSSYRGVGLFPLFHYGWERKTETDAERSLFLYPILSYFEWSENSTLHKLPVIPLLYYRKFQRTQSGTENYTSSTTYVFPVYWHSEGDGHHETWKFWLLPFLYTARGDNNANKQGSFFHLFPLFYYKNEESSQDASFVSRTIMFPTLPFLFYSSKYENTEADQEESTTYIFPFFRSIERTKDSEQTVTATPLFAHSTQDGNSSTWIFPFFFFTSNGDNGRESSAFYPFYAHRYTPPTETGEGSRTFWLMPFYYWRDEESHGSTFLPLYWYERGKAVDLTMITPLIWSRTDHVANDSLEVAPFYYAHAWMEKDKPRSTFYFLNYYSWNHAKSEGQITFPVHYRSSDALKEYDLWIPLAFSTTQSVMGLDTGGIYLDSDYSFGYNIFSISLRIPLLNRDILKKLFRRTEPEPSDQTRLPGVVDVRKEVGEKPQEGGPGKKTESGGPSVVRGKDLDPFDRSNTTAYFGWTALFGWTSYIRADTKRHFRMLPLAWLTWDVADEKDKLTYLPFYLDYRNGEERYHVIFPAFLPVYGRYEKGQTYIQVWGGPLYIDSYDAETKEAETSIVWPFFKKYSSPSEKGMRLFPVFAQKTWTEGNLEYSRSFSLLHYSAGQHSRTPEEDRSESYFISPLYFASSLEWTHHSSPVNSGNTAEPKVTPAADTTHRSSWSYLPVPLLFFGREDERTSWNFAFLFGGSGSDNGQSGSFYALPVFYRSREALPGNKRERTNLWILNLYHHYEDPSQDYEKTDIVWPLFEVWSSMNSHGWNIFPLFAWKKSEEKTEQSTTHFSPIHYFKDQATTDSSGGQVQSTSLWALFYYGDTYKSKGYNESDRWFLLPFLRRQEEVKSGGDCTSTTTKWRFYPLFYRTTEEYEPADRADCALRGTSNTLLLPFYYRDRSQSKYGDSGTDFVLLYYHTFSPERSFHNLAFLVDYEAEKTGWDLGLALGIFRLKSNESSTRFQLLYGLAADFERYAPGRGPNAYAGGYDFRFLNYIQRDNSREYGREFKTALWPIYSYYSDSNEKSLWLLPTLSYHQRKQNETFDFFPLLLWYRDYEGPQDHGVNFVLGGIAYYRLTKEERDYESRGTLWGILWNQEYERETGYSKFTIGYGLIFKKVEHPAGNRRYAKMLMLIPLYDEPINDGNGSIEDDKGTKEAEGADAAETQERIQDELSASTPTISQPDTRQTEGIGQTANLDQAARATETPCCRTSAIDLPAGL